MSSSDGAAGPSSSTMPAADRSQLLAQAIRFLTSARVTGDTTDETKREFLRSKGLSDDEIETVFRDATSPANSGSASSSSHLTATSTGPSSSHAPETEDEAFERAAREFDDPINAQSLAPPPRTYPKSPLALYYDAPKSSPPAGAVGGSASAVAKPASPLTRYEVLLQFFKTLSYLMMLGGGATALSVAVWRSYILPRITASFEARSVVLSHHHVLFDKLRHSVLTMASYLPIVPPTAQAKQQQKLSGRKGVLKKVHFGDEVDGGQLDDSSSSSSSSSSESLASDKGADESTEKTPLLEKEAESGATETAGGAEGPSAKEDATADSESAAAAGESSEAAQPKVEPIDLTEPLRQSISRLAGVLRADMSSSALGRPINPADTTTQAAEAAAAGTGSSLGSTAVPRAATVSDAQSDSGSEWSDSEPDSLSDDGLEFDPYGSYTKKKHTQASNKTASSSSSHHHSSSSSSSTTRPSKREGLRTSLSLLSADINSRSFSARDQAFASSALGMRFNTTSTAAPAGGNTGNEARSGEIGQVKAEIRSLKGLLLSRRNFPTYAGGARPFVPPPQQHQGGGERAASTVV